MAKGERIKRAVFRKYPKLSLLRFMRGVGGALLIVSSGCQGPTPTERAVQADKGSLPLETTPVNGQGAVFVDVAPQAGLHFSHSFGDSQFSNLIEAVGGGIAVFDFDRDGWMDVYWATGKHIAGVSQGPAPDDQPLNRLFRNRGDGTFEDVTERAGVGLPDRFSMGVSAGDYDNDGYPDLYVCNFGTSTLFHNQGNGTFAEVTEKAGVANSGISSVAATWLDYDLDGLLDLYVGGYIDFNPDYRQFYSPDGFPGPLSYKGQQDHLFHNLGGGRFEDVTPTMGLAGIIGRAMSVATIDFNEDGRQDLYVTNDATENFLFRNEGGKGFIQSSEEIGVGYNGMGDSIASMGVDFGDFDADGHFDIFVSANSIGSLFRNEGDGLFTDAVVESGIAMNSAQYVGWGSFFFDFDNDGDLDIFKTNSDLSRLFGQEDQVFENQGNGKFRDVSTGMGSHFRQTLLGRGAAVIDYDNDGDLDVLISNIGGPAVLLRNDGGNRNHWLKLDLRSQDGNREAVGAIVQLTAGGRTIKGFCKSSSGYLSCGDPRLHFGLGELPSVERIEIRWPSGRQQVIENVNTNQILELNEPQG